MGKLVRLRDHRINTIAERLEKRIVLLADLLAAELHVRVSRDELRARLILEGQTVLDELLDQVCREQPMRWADCDQELVDELIEATLLAMADVLSRLDQQSSSNPAPAEGARILASDTHRDSLSPPTQRRN